jgi:hypothetical protein
MHAYEETRAALLGRVRVVTPRPSVLRVSAWIWRKWPCG